VAVPSSEISLKEIVFRRCSLSGGEIPRDEFRVLLPEGLQNASLTY
jgi:hypothetical protein